MISPGQNWSQSVHPLTQRSSLINMGMIFFHGACHFDRSVIDRVPGGMLFEHDHFTPVGIISLRKIGAKMRVAAATLTPLQGGRGHHFGNLANIARLMYPHELVVVLSAEERLFRRQSPQSFNGRM